MAARTSRTPGGNLRGRGFNERRGLVRRASNVCKWDAHTPKGPWVGRGERRAEFPLSSEEDERLRSEEWQQNNPPTPFFFSSPLSPFLRPARHRVAEKMPTGKNTKWKMRSPCCHIMKVLMCCCCLLFSFLDLGRFFFFLSFFLSLSVSVKHGGIRGISGRSNTSVFYIQTLHTVTVIMIVIIIVIIYDSENKIELSKEIKVCPVIVLMRTSHLFI